jgi:hypothetical protein
MSDREEPEGGKRRIDDLVDMDADDLYDLIYKRYLDLNEGRSVVDQVIAMLKNSKAGDVPVTLEDQFEFLRRLFDEINVLYLSNLALIAQFKKRAIEEPESKSVSEAGSLPNLKGFERDDSGPD